MGGETKEALRFGALGDRCVHVWVDMHRLLAEATGWNTPWMPKLLPSVERIVAAHPAETVFPTKVTAP